MREDRDTPFDPDQPTLLVAFGNTTRKHRPLDRDVIVLGRSPSCDLKLVGAEVSPIHCLLLRCAGGGWRVRHFGGRIGTLLNGKPVEDAVVDHDDVLQIASFNLKFHLPPQFRRPGLVNDVPPESVEARHLRHSRRNLVRLALNLRGCLRETSAELGRARKQLEQQEHDLDALRTSARSRQEALDAARAQREADERDVLLRCQALGQHEAALAERWRAIEEEIARQRAGWAPPGSAADDEAQRLDRRRVELAHYARHLRRTAARLAEREAELAQPADEQPEKRDGVRCDGEEAVPSAKTDRVAVMPALRERLAAIQKLKVSLAMMRTSDSAPGVQLERAALDAYRPSSVTKDATDTPS
jgi:pSer/pThr/pTyr-binding forkhead associated (FHA) protein